jgi:undecaprenyl-diphosphatase
MNRQFVERQRNEILRDCSAAGSFSLLLLASLALFLVDKALAWAMLAGIVTVEFGCSIVKLIAYRVRPDRQRYTGFFEKVDSGSFPSIHTARAALALTLVYLYGRRPEALFVGVPILILVAVSRVLLKRHYLADVLAGAAFGVAAGWLLWRVLLQPWSA